MATSGSTLVASDRSVLERLREFGITESRALGHLHRGWVLVDGQVVTDPTYSATPPSKVELRVIRRSDSEEVDD